MKDSLRRLCPLALAAMVTLLPRISMAEQQARARLEYERPEDVEGCPDERSLRDAVSARLGYEPFAPFAPFADDADQTVVAAIRSTEDGLVGRVELRSEDGELLGERRLESPGLDCREFASALTLSIALAIDPLAIERAESGEGQTPGVQTHEEDEEERENVTQPVVTASEPTIESESESESQVSQPSTNEEEPRDRIAVRVRLNAHGSLGTAPRLAFGMDLQVGIRWRFFSIGLEGRADVPATDEALGGQVKTMLMHLSLVPCLHWHVIAGCAVVGGGALRGEGEGYFNNEHQFLQYWTVGGRLAVEVPLVRWLLFHAHLDLLGAPVRIELTVDDVIAWRSPPVAFTFGGGFSASF